VVRAGQPDHDHDEEPKMSRKFDRRQALAAFGTVSLGSVLAACGGGGDSGGKASVTTEEGPSATVEPRTSTPDGIFDDSTSCSVTTEQTEGPYYFDVDSIRSDIREGKDGTALTLAIRVRDAQRCEPLENAVVDIWHCDATGVYSGFEAASTGAGPGGGRSDEETYLRGAQVTNKDGVVQFKTIYPGAYSGRTVHIHAKVHVDRETALTSQLYFDDEVTDEVTSKAPYESDREVRNDSDGLFDENLVLTLRKQRDGWLGVMTFDVEAAA
jgi:protocatechuate 3,4-dioxygenase beta subunit